MPRIFWAVSRAALAPLTTFTPPPLPRPPAWICALTTTNSLSVSAISALAAASASSGLNAGRPLGTGTPSFLRISFAWYSWIFTSGTSELLPGFDHLAHRRGRLVEHRLLLGGQLDRHDLLDAASADHDRHAQVEILVAVLAIEVRGARQQALLVLEVRGRHRDRGGRRRQEGAGPHQLHDLAAAVARPIDDRRQLVAGDQLLDRDAVDRAVADHRHHRVAVAAQHH